MPTGNIKPTIEYLRADHSGNRRNCHDRPSPFCRRLLLSAFCFLPFLPGCASYQFGNATLFPPDIHTVYVPMVESKSFRPNLGEALTEAICKQIEKETPYKVVGNPNADSILTVKLIQDTKRVDRQQQVRRSPRNRSQLSSANHLDQSQRRIDLQRRRAAAAAIRRTSAKARPTFPSTASHTPPANTRWCRNWRWRSSA